MRRVCSADIHSWTSAQPKGGHAKGAWVRHSGAGRVASQITARPTVERRTSRRSIRHEETSSRRSPPLSPQRSRRPAWSPRLALRRRPAGAGDNVFSTWNSGDGAGAQHNPSAKRSQGSKGGQVSDTQETQISNDFQTYQTTLKNQTQTLQPMTPRADQAAIARDVGPTLSTGTGRGR